MELVNHYNMKQVLVTGAAGFIGYHLCERLIQEGYKVIGLDNINEYYDVNLKFARLSNLGINKSLIFDNELIKSEKHASQFQFIKMNLEDRDRLPDLFKKFTFDIVCNLAAQAGVRYSIENPMAYIDSNIVGFANLLECCRHYKVPKLIYASSSSVYGNSDEVPFKEDQRVDHPISLYAATKKSNELMAYTYSHLYGIETIGLRFFTVYGPWGRPDMAMFLFTDAILKGKPIQVYNNGELWRDFTYIDDIIEGIYYVIKKSQNVNAKNQLFNIGNNKPVNLTDFINEIERLTRKKSKRVLMKMQPGDVLKTWSDIELLNQYSGYYPKTTIDIGIKKFIEWYMEYFDIEN